MARRVGGRVAQALAAGAPMDVALRMGMSPAHRNAWLYWKAARLIATRVRQHPRRSAVRTLATLVVLFALGLTGSVTVVLAAAVTAGWWLLAWERRSDPLAPPGSRRPWHRSYWRHFLSTRRHRRYWVGATNGTTVLWLGLLNPLLGLAVGAGSLWWVGRLRGIQPDPEPTWWSERQLVALLRARGVGLVGQLEQVTLSRLGRPHVDGDRESVAWRMPDGLTWRQLRGKQDGVASFLDVEPSRVLIEHAASEGKGEGWTRLTLLRQTPARVTRVSQPSPLITAERTDALAPARLGVDEDTGEPLHVDNDEACDLTAGIMGTGKTELTRSVLGGYLLDPRAYGFGGDGKGSRKDYGPALATGFFSDWVWGTDDDGPQRLVALCERVLGIVRWRNTHDDGHQDYQPVLLLLEELQDFLAGATDEQYERIVDAIARIERMGRAVRVKVSIVTQRTSVNDIPAAIRNLIANRVCLTAMQPEDYKLVLGVTASKLGVRTPTRKQGQGILRTPGGLFPLVPDRLPLAEWRDLCQRARALRQAEPAGDDPTDPALQRLHTAASALPAAPPNDDDEGLVAAAERALREACEPLSAAKLWARLPADLRPKDARQLGVDLARLGCGRLVKKSYKGSPAWHLTLAATPGLTLVKTPAQPSHEGQNGPIHAQQPARKAVP